MRKYVFLLLIYDKCTYEILDANIKNKELVNKSDISKFINNFDLDKNIETLATKADLKAEQDKIVKLQTYDSSLYIGQSYFFNDGPQNFLLFQPILNTFTMHTVLAETIVAWESKALSNEIIRFYITSDKNIYAKLKWYNSGLQIEFKRGY